MLMLSLICFVLILKGRGDLRGVAEKWKCSCDVEQDHIMPITSSPAGVARLPHKLVAKKEQFVCTYPSNSKLNPCCHAQDPEIHVRTRRLWDHT